MLVIIDNGMGNLMSVSSALSKLKVNHKITSNVSDIKKSSAIIFPGVGAFPKAMKNLKKKNLHHILKTKILKENTPYLGICLGMQILFEYSDEIERTKGLSILKGSVKKIKSIHHPVPHVGWNTFYQNKKNIIFRNIKKNTSFYYDHSYYVESNAMYNVATLRYSKEMTVAVNKKNIFGLQFHPEKSQRNGLKVLRNFCNLIE